ncbi:hypothetical protein niasHS_008048 [Heterodera schachtii]|uniref:Hexosyltransferase n=1 Tax=Heterodera schachtii TaxID=97005 RepID=A0ABD2JC84_HETSC
MQNDFLANLHQNSLAFLADYSALWLLGVDIMQTMNNRQLQQEMKLFISRGSNCTMEALMNEEQKKHGDFLLFRGFVDKYMNLHFKSYGGFVWQQRHCANAKWMLKMDDDTVVHIPRMAHWIENKFRHIATKHPLLFVGVGGHRDPVRDPNGLYKKWSVNEVLYRQVFYLEDVMYTGILGELANATVLDQKKDYFWFSYQSEHEVGQFGTQKRDPKQQKQRNISRCKGRNKKMGGKHDFEDD